MEFDFEREARVASTIRANLQHHGRAYPLLQRVVVPAMVPSHSSSRVLTMEFLDGVPLLDVAGMDMVGLVRRRGVVAALGGLYARRVPPSPPPSPGPHATVPDFLGLLAPAGTSVVEHKSTCMMHACSFPDVFDSVLAPSPWHMARAQSHTRDQRTSRHTCMPASSRALSVCAHSSLPHTPVHTTCPLSGR